MTPLQTRRHPWYTNPYVLSGMCVGCALAGTYWIYAFSQQETHRIGGGRTLASTDYTVHTMIEVDVSSPLIRLFRRYISGENS